MGSDSAAVDSSKVLKDILGVVINMYAKNDDIEKVKKTSDENAYRIAQLEAKVGNADEIALPLGLAVRHLPLPSEGTTELDNVRLAFREIQAPGVDVKNDIVKAVRVGYKAESDPGANNQYLGTVKVEMRNEESRASVMKSKYQLKNHPQNVMKKLVIQNLKSREDMKNEYFNYDILKMVTNSSDFYIGGNGHIRKKDQNNQRVNTAAPPTRYAAAFPASYASNAAPQASYAATAIPPTSYATAAAPPSRYAAPTASYAAPPARYAARPQYSQFNVPPPPTGQYHYDQTQRVHLQRPQDIPPEPSNRQQQTSLLDIDNIFTFDPPKPVQTTNPYQPPTTVEAQPQPVQAGPHAPPVGGQGLPHHGRESQGDQ